MDAKAPAHRHDAIVFAPDGVDLSRSPLSGEVDAETYVLGAFNPGLTRLPNGNLLMMVRIAEALRHPIHDSTIRAIRWDEGRYTLDAWPLPLVDTADPRKFMMRGGGWKVMALTSLSWLLPVELDADGLRIEVEDLDAGVGGGDLDPRRDEGVVRGRGRPGEVDRRREARGRDPRRHLHRGEVADLGDVGDRPDEDRVDGLAEGRDRDPPAPDLRVLGEDEARVEQGQDD